MASQLAKHRDPFEKLAATHTPLGSIKCLNPKTFLEESSYRVFYNHESEIYEYYSWGLQFYSSKKRFASCIKCAVCLAVVFQEDSRPREYCSDCLRLTQREKAMSVILDETSGDKSLRCQQCGCNVSRLLQIHHRNADGNKERKSINNSRFYGHIIREERDVDDLMVLCNVCHDAAHNHLKGISGRYVIRYVPDSEK